MDWGFSTKNIIKNKLRNRLTTSTVDMLMIVSLNSIFLNLDRAVDHFIANKQQKFKAFVEMKMEHLKEKQATSRFIIYCILNFLVSRIKWLFWWWSNTGGALW